jgi:hypothetical protein
MEVSLLKQPTIVLRLDSKDKRRNKILLVADCYSPVIFKGITLSAISKPMGTRVAQGSFLCPMFFILQSKDFS